MSAALSTAIAGLTEAAPAPVVVERTAVERATALPCVARTLPDKKRYLTHVKKYAEGKARSKVGNAVRRGASAHEYDDKLDGDK